MRSQRLLVHGAAELLTCAADAPDLIGRVENGSVLIENGTVVAAGVLPDMETDSIIDASGSVVMPGFIDCHTHVVFGGSRVDEYVADCAGTAPPAGSPVGIVGTMRATRPLSARELADASAPRLREMLAHGTTTGESKSGYGLTPKSEIAMLEANTLLSRELGIDIVSTYLGAHAFPPDVDRAAYVDKVCATIPEVAGRGLATFCDVYCDDGYFSVEESRRILETAVDHRLRPKLHLDAYAHTGAANLAIELGAITVDHLNHTTAAEVDALASAGVIGVVMPLLDFAVGHSRPTYARSFVEGGLRIALATDMCPGCYTTSMQVVIQHACRVGGLTIAQAIRAATLDAAAAVGRADTLGSLEPGKRADLLILDTGRHEDLAYRIGHNAVRTVMREGKVVV
jgi:imidazolonepropionase